MHRFQHKNIEDGSQNQEYELESATDSNKEVQPNNRESKAGEFDSDSQSDINSDNIHNASRSDYMK